MEFSFQIGDETYDVPSVLTVGMFQSAIAWDLEDVKNHKPFVSTITKCSLQNLSLLDDETFNILLAACVTSLPTDGDMTKSVGVFQLKDFDTFSFGDFIDIDVYIADGLTKHVVDLVAKLYDMPIEQAADTDIQRVWSTMLALAKWRELVYKEHDEFFELSQGGSDDTMEFSINRLQLMWYEAVLSLSNGEFLNIGPVTDRPYKEALNFLTWKKNEIAKQKLEQVKRKYDLQKRSR